jgi:hypothetical protein
VKLTTQLILLPKLRTSEALPPLPIGPRFNKDNFNIIWAVKTKVPQIMAHIIKTFRNACVTFNVVYYSEMYGV